MPIFWKHNADKPNRYKWAPLKTRKIIYNPPHQKSILDQLPRPHNGGKTNQ